MTTSCPGTNINRYARLHMAYVKYALLHLEYVKYALLHMPYCIWNI